MVVALQQAQARVAEVRTSLPSDLELIIDRLTPAAFPFISINLTGGLSSADLYDYAFYVMRLFGESPKLLCDLTAHGAGAVGLVESSFAD